MEHSPVVLIALLTVLTVATVLAPRVRIPLPVLLALAGIALAFVPGFPAKPLDPELILFGFLPPLLYADAFDTSWVDFRRWLRPILMLAVALVAVTIAVVGVVAHALLPEMPWPVCFTLGAIVSPTDTVAIQAVLERLRLPRRVTAILGGESLVNDATGLVGVQIGVAVVLSGAFEARQMLTGFAWVAGGGVAVGIGVGVLFAWLNGLVARKEALFTLSVLSPYLAFWTAHGLGSSGVLAVVVAGFVVAWRIHRVPPEARVDLYATWELVIRALEGLCFVFIGLETPRLVRETAVAQQTHLLWAGLGVSAAVILVRLIWIFPAGYLPLALSPRLRRREGGYPRWRIVAIAGWCGVRGIVSLAAALSIPATLEDGSPFPERKALLACSLCVIAVTLFVQAPTLPPLIRALGIREDDDGTAEVHEAREALLVAGIARLDEFCSEVSCPISVHHLRSQMADELAELKEEDADARARAATRLAVSQDVHRAVALAQTEELLKLRDRGRINDRSYVELQLELDRELAGHARRS